MFWTRRNIILLTLGTVLGAALIIAGLNWWGEAVRTRRALDHLELAKQLTQQNQPRQALDTLRLSSPAPLSPEARREWISLQLELATELRDLVQIRSLAQAHPELLAQHAVAVNLYDRIALALDEEPFPRTKYQLPETDPLLRVDALIQQGDPEEAAELLRQLQRTSQALTPQIQQRLAILTAKSPDEAWEHLVRAYEADPANPDTRTFLGNVLEISAQPDAARRELVAAWLLDPQNPRRADNLAQFYLRRGQVRAAINTWNSAVPEDWTRREPTLPLQAWFWEKMVYGSPVIPDPAPPLANWLPVRPEIFWRINPEDTVAFEQAYPGLVGRPEVLWSRALEHLRQRQDEPARQLLSFAESPFSRDLQAAMRLILAARLGEAVDPGSVRFAPRNQKGNPFWAWFPEQSAETLRSDWVPVAALLGAGYFHAATILAESWDLHKSLSNNPESSQPPAWFHYGLAKAWQIQGNPRNAIWVLEARPNQPAHQVLRGELLLAAGNVEEALQAWENLLRADAGDTDHPANTRAAWLLSLAYLERNEPDQVTRILENSGQFQQSVMGQEIRARALLAQGQRSQALAIYEKIQEHSSEAVLVLAKDAFGRQDWNRAQFLMEKLASDNPNEPAFTENLERIRQARGSPATAPTENDAQP